MIKNNKLFDSWKKMILPLCFVLSYIVNIILYYLGLAFRENPAREYGFMLCCIVFAICTGLSFLHVVKKEKIEWKSWLLLSGVVLFFVTSYGVGLYKYGVDSLLFSYLKKFIVFSIPAFFVGICAAKWGTVQDFLVSMEKLSFIVLPAAVIYFNQVLFDANPFNYGRDLGIIHYMSFAYSLMPFLLTHIVCFSEGAALKIPFTTKELRHPQVIRAVIILVNWVSIYSSGTRGAIVCVAVFCLFLLVFRVSRGMKFAKTVVIAGIMLVILLFNMFVYAPVGMKGIGRMSMFVEGLKEGKIVTATEDEVVEDSIDDLVSATTPIEGRPGTENVAVDSNADIKPDEDEQNVIDPSQIRNRGTLYKLAFKEFIKSPYTGMGPGGYSEKYGKYPHNAVLELLAETGLVGTLVLIALVLIALKRMVIDGWRDNNVQYFLLFIIAYAVYANISGTVWDCRALLCALGFGLTYKPSKQEK